VYIDGRPSEPHVKCFSIYGNVVQIDSSWYSYDPLTDRSRWAAHLTDLAPKTCYLIRISQNPGFDGEADYMTYFITEDNEMPVVLDHTPPSGAWLVGLMDKVKVVFNKPLNVFTVDPTSFYVSGPSGRLTGDFDFGVEELTTTSFTPLAPYSAGTQYTVVLTSHIQDNLGNSIDSLSWDFTTGLFDTVGYDGAVMSSGGFTLRFVRGCFSSDVEIGGGAIPPSKVPGTDGMVFTGLAYDLEPSVTLEREAVLTIEVPDSIVAEYGPADQLKVYSYDSAITSWKYVGGTASGHRVSVAIDHLGRYGLFQSDVLQVSTDFASSVTLTPRVISPRRGGDNAELVVSFELSVQTDVDARVYNTSGRLIKTLWSGMKSDVGENVIRWDGRESNGGFANDGLYVLVIEAEGKKVQKTFVVVNN
jgi:hypothetical protein